MNKQICKRCNEKFIRYDGEMQIWNPNWTLPVGIYAYDEFELCEDCKEKLLKIIKKFIRGFK